MNLNEQERRELNDIAQRLEREDGRLASMLSAMKPRPAVTVGRAGKVAALVAAAVFLLAIMAAAVGHAPSSRPGDRSIPPSNSGAPVGDAGNRPAAKIDQPESPVGYAIHNDARWEMR